MRKQPKSFTVEVKRRPSSLAKKPALVDPAPVAPQPPAAAAIFAPVEQPVSATDAQRRILPCLVTEAAIDAAKFDPVEDVAPRRRGRPRKERSPDDLAPLAPRKRGRPRKNPLEAQEPVKPVRAPAPQPAAQPRPMALVATAPVGASARSGARRAAVSELPRGERWKRRLPKALR